MMKKTYVVPESKLIALNLSESIAVSGGIDEVGGMSVIRFYSEQDGCRKTYTERLPVKEELWTGGDFGMYYNDFLEQVELNGPLGFEAYYYCFGRAQNV